MLGNFALLPSGRRIHQAPQVNSGQGHALCRQAMRVPIVQFVYLTVAAVKPKLSRLNAWQRSPEKLTYFDFSIFLTA